MHSRVAELYPSGHRTMKLFKTIIATTLAILAVQLLCFFILFVAWFFRFILQWFVTLGSSQWESWLESLLQIVIKVFTYPARLFFEDIQASENVFTLVLQSE